jgi:hypothetical protein
MKNLSRISLIALASVAGVFAQAVTPSTTLGAALTATATTVNLASITNVVAQTGIYVDNEFMLVIRTPSVAQSVSVVRGQSSGTGPVAHATGAKVWLALTPDKSVVPGVNGFNLRAALAAPGGTCVRTGEVYLPKIYVNLGAKFDCDVNTLVWRPYLISGPPAFVTDAGANNAITSPVGSQPVYTGLIVSVTLAHSLQAGANTFAYAGGTALAIKSSRAPANSIATAYVSTAVINLVYTVISGTGTWLDLNQ